MRYVRGMGMIVWIVLSRMLSEKSSSGDKGEGEGDELKAGSQRMR